MNAIDQLRRLAAHQDRNARLALAQAEQARAVQQATLEESASTLQRALASPSEGANDELTRHTFALRAEMVRRGAERRLLERQREVNRRQDAMRVAAREKGTLDRLIERRDDAQGREAAQREQRGLDEAGITGWWRQN